MIPIYLRMRPTGGSNPPWLQVSGSQTVQRGNEEHQFAAVFENANQEQVYKQCVAPLVGEVLCGKSAAFFTLGATGSGKTYTVQGTPTDRGVVYRALEALLAEGPVTLAMTEIYNDRVYDLLDINNRKPLLVRANGNVEALRVPVLTAAAAEDVLERGYAARAVQATQMNQASSRSHCFIMLQTSTATLTIADLAGSERVNDAGSLGAQRVEAGEINKSLMLLGHGLQQLQQGSSPMRGSKLTQLLLGRVRHGVKTCMLVTIDPRNNAKSGMQILRYASTARQLRAPAPPANPTNASVGLNSGNAADTMKKVYAETDRRLAEAVADIWK